MTECASPTRAAGAPWMGFHLFLAGPPEPFLTGHLFRWVEAETRDGRLRRFFFLRYSEGGDHLRIRLLASTSGGEAVLEAGLTACVAGSHGGESRLERHPYDRAALYFGETAESLYAELLNQATSMLALALLPVPGLQERGRLRAALGATLRLLQHASTAGPADFAHALQESRDFARRAAADHGVVLHGDGGPAVSALAAVLDAAAPRLEVALAGDPHVRRIGVLLRRVRRRGPRGRFVATHALHLLCNKLGFGLPEEHDLFAALLCRTSSAPAPGAGHPTPPAEAR